MKSRSSREQGGARATVFFITLACFFLAALTLASAQRLLRLGDDESKPDYAISAAASEPREIQASYQAFNASQGLRAYFRSKGATIVRAMEGQPSWQESIDVSEFGAGADVALANPTGITATPERLDYALSGGLKGWFENTERGIEQGFKIERPNGEPSAHTLHIDLAANGPLELHATMDGTSIDLTGPDGVVPLRLSLLRAVGNDGVELPARFEILPETSTAPAKIRIALDVADVSAYPATIQTLFDSPLLPPPPPSCVPPPSGMVGWWRFDEQSGLTAIDSSGSNNTGSILGSPAWIAGEVDSALHFDGVNDEVDVNSSASLNFGTGNFSIDFWMRTTIPTDSNVRVILDKRVASSVGYEVYLFQGKLGFQISGTNYGGGPLVNTGNWVHVAITVDRVTNGLNFWVDGSTVATFTPLLTTVTNTSQLFIGRHRDGSQRYLGDLDELEFFNRTLTATEVLKLYSAGPIGKCKYLLCKNNTCAGGPSPTAYFVALPIGSAIKNQTQLFQSIPNRLYVEKYNRVNDTWRRWDGSTCCQASLVKGGTCIPTAPEPSCSQSCFCVNPGEGFATVVSSPSSYDVLGSDGSMTIPLLAPGAGTSALGLNLISLPFCTTITTASQLMNSIGFSSVAEVKKYLCASDTYQAYSSGKASGPDFALVTGEAYFVRMTTTTNYTTVYSATCPAAGCVSCGPNGSACNDGDPCTQTDVCSGGVCVGTNPVACSASDSCHDAGVCDVTTGLCSNPPAANGTSCNDGNACTQTDTCLSGICTGANPVVCTASDQCHFPGICNAGTGLCSNPPKDNGTPCSDGNPCTQLDMCLFGICSGSNPVSCTASDQCHDVGTCSPGTGVCSNPPKNNGTSCDDGNACTFNDACVGGVCTGTSPTHVVTGDVTCDNQFAIYTAATESPGMTVNYRGITACHPAVPSVSLSTTDRYLYISAWSDNGTAQGLLHDLWVDGQAAFSGNPRWTVTYTDADYAQCITPPAAMAATMAATIPAPPGGWVAPAVGCANPPPGQNCLGVWGHFAAIDLSARRTWYNSGGDPSPNAPFSPGFNHREFLIFRLDMCSACGPDGSSCNDGNPCTQTDMCQSGACVGSNSVVCTASDQCHDAGTCVPATGTCSNPAKPNGVACNDANGCTQTDTCQSGTCTGANPVVCPSSDSCHPAGTCIAPAGTCTNPVAADGTACNDGNACTAPDSCLNGACGCHVVPAVAIYANATPVTIPTTVSVVSSSITVGSANRFISRARVTTSITHTNNAHLDVTLTSPSGTVVTLTSDNGMANDNVFNGTLWDDKADPSGQVPYASNGGIVTDAATVNNVVLTPVVAEEALAAFHGEDPNGVWILRVSDDTDGEGGTLAGWSLELTTLPDAPTTSTSTFTNATPTVLADNPAVSTSSVVVATAGTVIDHVRATTFIRHTFPGDLDVTLRSPAGTVVTLTTDNGATRDNVFNGTIWDDKADPGGQVPFAADTLASSRLASDTVYANNVPKATLAPEEALGAFQGENPNGVWTLTSSDDSSGDTGTLDRWSLEVTTVADACNVTCNDHDPCTSDSCSAPTGCANIPVSCDDQNPCTDDVCDPVSGCLHTERTGSCNDNNPCTVGDTCLAGVCAGTLVDCEDGNICTDNACVPALGGACTSTPHDGLTCNDGDVCTVSDHCQGGACVGDSLNCDDGNACTDDGCDSSLPWGCVHVDSDGTCDDGNTCTVGDHCDSSGPGGLSESFDQVGPPQLPAGWSAQVTPGAGDGWETVATASHTPPNSATAGFQSFGEQLSLTSPEFFVGCPSPLTFRNKYDLEANYDGAVLEIAIDGGSFIDIIQAGGSFVAGGYVTTISTAFGSAIGGRPAWTGTSNGFIVTSVNLPPGAVGHSIQLRWRVVTDATVCGTGQFIDTVVAGWCPKTCAGFPRICDDNNPCTFDACVPAAGGCVFTPSDGLTCSDNNPCTADACVGGVCTSGPPTGPADIANSVRVGRSGTTAILTWNDPPGSYNVYAGLRSGPPLTYNQTCIANSISVSTANHVPVPAVGSFYYYLVTRKDAICGESTLGPRSSGVTRPNLNPCVP